MVSVREFLIVLFGLGAGKLREEAAEEVPEGGGLFMEN